MLTVLFGVVGLALLVVFHLLFKKNVGKFDTRTAKSTFKLILIELPLVLGVGSLYAALILFLKSLN